MTTVEMQAIEGVVSDAVLRGSPADLSSIIESAVREDERFSPAVVQQVIWRLIGTGVLQLTRDWRLVKR